MFLYNVTTHSSQIDLRDKIFYMSKLNQTKAYISHILDTRHDEIKLRGQELIQIWTKAYPEIKEYLHSFKEELNLIFPGCPSSFTFYAADIPEIAQQW